MQLSTLFKFPTAVTNPFFIHRQPTNLLFVDPVVLSALPALDLALVEPQGNLLLAVLDAVRAVAHVATDVESVVATDGAGGRGKGVGSTEDGAASLDGVTSFPDHSADGARAHV